MAGSANQRPRRQGVCLTYPRNAGVRVSKQSSRMTAVSLLHGVMLTLRCDAISRVPATAASL
jgi:hypothetical protein